MYSRREGQVTSRHAIQSGIRKSLPASLNFQRNYFRHFIYFASCSFMHIISVTFQFKSRWLLVLNTFTWVLLKVKSFTYEQTICKFAKYLHLWLWLLIYLARKYSLLQASMHGKHLSITSHTTILWINHYYISKAYDISLTTPIWMMWRYFRTFFVAYSSLVYAHETWKLANGVGAKWRTVPKKGHTKLTYSSK